MKHGTRSRYFLECYHVVSAAKAAPPSCGEREDREENGRRYRSDSISSCRDGGSYRYKFAPFELLMARYGELAYAIKPRPLTSFHPCVSRELSELNPPVPMTADCGLRVDASSGQRKILLPAPTTG